MKKFAQRLAKVLDKSAEKTAAVNKIIIGAQQLPKEMKK